MSSQEGKLVAQFEKNSAEIVKVHLQEWRTGTYVDIRVWASMGPGGEPGEVPTRKGITLAVDLLPELRTAIDKAIAEIEFGQEIGK